MDKMASSRKPEVYIIYCTIVSLAKFAGGVFEISEQKRPAASTRILASTREYSTPKITRVIFKYTTTRLIPLPVGNFNFRFQFSKLTSNNVTRFYAET